MSKIKKIKQLHNLANFGRLSAGIIHDLINPLNALELNLDQAIDINKNKECGENLKLAKLACLNMKNILISAKNQINCNDKKNYFNIKKEIDKMIKLINYKIKKSNINLKTEIHPSIKIYGQKTKFNRVLTNLIINAVDACKKSRKKYKEITIKAFKQKKKLIIQIIDNGCGIPQSQKKQLFKPFFSQNNSLGLGLYLSNQIIKNSFNGSIETKINDKNTIFQIKINC